MPNNSPIEPYPLKYLTPPHWAQQVLRDPVALLNDHAHLEKKAAANALELLNRRPDRCDERTADQWTATMTSVARDEIEHLVLVARLLERRGGRMSNTHRNPYAAALRKLVRLGDGPNELIDRLMVSALIELRSCERFEVLANHGGDGQLTNIYRKLADSERGHYLVFVNLARSLGQGRATEARWRRMLDAEATIIAAQPPGPRMHSGAAS